MFYIIYKTTNLISGKYYIGCHQTNLLNDGYIGSGKYLKRAIKKYGKNNFHFEILYFAKDKEEMFSLEKQIVTKELINDNFCYNLKLGGEGGNPGLVGAFKGKKHSVETKNKLRDIALKQIVSDETKNKISLNNWSKSNPEAFKKHITKIASEQIKTEEHKLKLSIAQKGKRLVNNGLICKWAKQNELNELISKGWILGKIK